MKKYNLDFYFKGSRKYVQGPDIFDAVLDVIRDDFKWDGLTDIKYAAHEMLHKNADLIVIEQFNKNDYEKINSIITFKYEDKKYFAVVIENENEIENSSPYSEEIVRTQSNIDGDKILFDNTLDDSITEIIVSMNKYYLQKTVTEDGKWIVTKFEYNDLKSMNSIKNKKLQLELKNNFNNKLTKSVVIIDDKTVGNLYFSLI